jgi:hypothetical protein
MVEVVVMLRAAVQAQGIAANLRQSLKSFSLYPLLIIVRFFHSYRYLLFLSLGSRFTRLNPLKKKIRQSFRNPVKNTGIYGILAIKEEGEYACLMYR